MLKHEIEMSRGERLVYYILSRLPNLKLTVHQATLRSHPRRKHNQSPRCGRDRESDPRV